MDQAGLPRRARAGGRVWILRRARLLVAAGLVTMLAASPVLAQSDGDGGQDSDDAALTSLSLHTGSGENLDLDPTFDPEVLVYTAEVDNDVSRVGVLASAAGAIEYAWAPDTRTIFGGLEANLEVGLNPLQLVVTSPSGLVERSYTVNITRQVGTQPASGQDPQGGQAQGGAATAADAKLKNLNVFLHMDRGDALFSRVAPTAGLDNGAVSPRAMVWNGFYTDAELGRSSGPGDTLGPVTRGPVRKLAGVTSRRHPLCASYTYHDTNSGEVVPGTYTVETDRLSLWHYSLTVNVGHLCGHNNPPQSERSTWGSERLWPGNEHSVHSVTIAPVLPDVTSPATLSVSYFKADGTSRLFDADITTDGFQVRYDRDGGFGQEITTVKLKVDYSDGATPTPTTASNTYTLNIKWHYEKLGNTVSGSQCDTVAELEAMTLPGGDMLTSSNVRPWSSGGKYGVSLYYDFRRLDNSVAPIKGGGLFDQVGRYCNNIASFEIWYSTDRSKVQALIDDDTWNNNGPGGTAHNDVSTSITNVVFNHARNAPYTGTRVLSETRTINTTTFALEKSAMTADTTYYVAIRYNFQPVCENGTSHEIFGSDGKKQGDGNGVSNCPSAGGNPIDNTPSVFSATSEVYKANHLKGTFSNIFAVTTHPVGGL